MSSLRERQIEEIYKLYVKGAKKSAIRAMGYSESVYCDFLRKTKDRRERIGLCRDKKAALPPKKKKGKYVDPVYTLAQQGYMVGDIAEALGITIDQCRERYNKERMNHVKIKVRPSSRKCL